jgi:hypothetical protein
MAFANRFFCNEQWSNSSRGSEPSVRQPSSDRVEVDPIEETGLVQNVWQAPPTTNPEQDLADSLAEFLSMKKPPPPKQQAHPAPLFFLQIISRVSRVR